MKRCPECHSEFPDSDRFCELDGTPLVPAQSDTSAAITDQTEQEVLPIAVSEPGLQPEASWKIIAIAVSGVIIGVILFLIYYEMTREPATESSKAPSSNSSVVQQQGPLLPSLPSPVASPSPSVAPSPSPSVMPAPSPSPSPQTGGRVELSSSPISTGGDGKPRSGPVLIRLTDGTSIEADEVWQTGEGIWYRRGNIVALLDPKQVKAIERVTPATPSPSPSQSSSP
ncbi:MAG: hypothetical protein ACREBG_13220 [Pyrinomonadaceae bacterium]